MLCCRHGLMGRQAALFIIILTASRLPTLLARRQMVGLSGLLLFYAGSAFWPHETPHAE